MTITVIGTGFVGVVSSAVYASLGHRVYGLDIDENKIRSLSTGQIPFFEPNLADLVAGELKSSRLTFTTSYQEAISNSDVIIIAVGTPSASDGQADLKFVFASAKAAAPFLKDKAIVAIKSTVPPGTLGEMSKIIDVETKTKYYTASLPEFLREGSAVHDTQFPDRIVLGATDDFVFEQLEELHRPLQAPMLRVKPESAQMGKYTANAYLATRITFINQIADLCDKNGADVSEVINIIGEDKRIGKHYWYPGLGYGGSCFPKDVKELAAYSRAVGEGDNLLNKISELNENRINKIFSKLEVKIGGFENKSVAILGLAFKPHTDDTREAPALKIIPYLLGKGAEIKTFDPMVKLNFEGRYTQANSIDEAIDNADIIIAVVEWPEIISHDYAKSKKEKLQYVFDARNQLNAEVLKNAGFLYIGIGRQN